MNVMPTIEATQGEATQGKATLGKATMGDSNGRRLVVLSGGANGITDLPEG